MKTKLLFLSVIAIFFIAIMNVKAQEMPNEHFVLQDSIIRCDSIMCGDSLILCCDTMMCCDSVHREKVRFGIKIGGQVSRVDDIHDITKQRIPGLTIGASLKIPLLKEDTCWVFFAPELLYSQEGEKRKTRSDGSIEKFYLDYISVPLMFKGYFAKNQIMFLEFGPEISFLIYHKNKDTDLGKARKFDFGLGIGGGASLGKNNNFEIGARLNLGALDTYRDVEWRNFNIRGAVTLAYIFGENSYSNSQKGHKTYNGYYSSRKDSAVNKKENVFLYEISENTPIGISLGRYSQTHVSPYFSLRLNTDMLKVAKKYNYEGYEPEVNISIGLNKMVNKYIWVLAGIGYVGMSEWDYGVNNEYAGDPKHILHSGLAPEAGALIKLGPIALKYTCQFRLALEEGFERKMGRIRHVGGIGFCF